MKDIEVENYESNIKEFHNLKRKELEMLITTTIPNQISTMKTLLWINIIWLGFFLQLVSFPLDMLQKSFLLLLFSSIATIIIALLTNRAIAYGTFDDYKVVLNDSDKGVYSISQNYINLTKHTQEAIKENFNVITSRAKLMHISTWFIFISSLIFATILFNSSNLKKGGTAMSGTKETSQKPTTTTVQQPAIKKYANSK